MSKYNNLLEPLSCEWVCPLTGTLCGESFDNMDSFISHVREEHLPSTSLSPPTHQSSQQDAHSTAGVCQWQECQFRTMNTASSEFVIHVLFHPHHSYLKLLGKEYQARQVLPACQIDPELVNVLPLIEVDLKCQWGAGEKCGVEFDCVSNLYSHVHKHVAKGGLTCRWQGELKQLIVSCCELELFLSLSLSLSPQTVLINVVIVASYWNTLVYTQLRRLLLVHPVVASLLTTQS